MPPALKLGSTSLKKAVKKQAKTAAKIITQGERAVKAARKAAAKSPRDKKLRSRVKRNLAMLAKAKKLSAGLLKSQRLADSMCPLQVAYLEFHFE